MAIVKVYTTSLHANRVEYDHSQQAIQLFTVKGVSFEEIDLNNKEAVSNSRMRAVLYSFRELYKIKRSNNISTWPLPQVTVNGVYIGGYLELQYLEDSGDLDKILSSKRCAHVYLHFYKGNLLGTLSSYSYCPLCSPNPDLVIKIDSNYSNSFEDFQLIRTLLNSYVTFTVIDTDNPKIPGGRSHKIHGYDISSEDLIKYARSNVLRGMLNKETCIYCCRKTILSAICNKCN